jgi:hypothetical protein
MFITDKTIRAGAAVLRDADIVTKADMGDLAKRVFIAMIECYSSGPRLIPYSLSPRPQRGAD